MKRHGRASGTPSTRGKRRRSNSKDSSDDDGDGDYVPVSSSMTSSSSNDDEGFVEKEAADIEVRVSNGRKKQKIKKNGRSVGKGQGGRGSGEGEPSMDADDGYIYLAPDPEPTIVSSGAGLRNRRKTPKKGRGKRAGSREGDICLIWEVLEELNERWLDEQESKGSGGDNLSDQTASTAEAIDPSQEVILPLLRFQKEWLAWALKQETSECRGGILADEMGMGKTIQAISLVLTTRSLQSATGGAHCELPPCSSSSSFPSLPRVRCTLVICPVVAVIQWVGEIERYTEKGSTKVLVYHGVKRANVKYDFDDYDFVLTTYSTIEGDFRKNVMEPKEKCQWCGKSLRPHKMKVHLKYFCGPGAKKTVKQSRQTSKKGGYAPKMKLKKSFDLEDGTDSWKKRRRGVGKTKKHDESIGISLDPSILKSVLHSVKWERIILDEAHFIKDRRSNTARAVFALRSSYKWALSGTPLQNRVGELYSLVRFLQINPYSYYFCKDCDCRILDYSTSQNCSSCDHSTVRHFCWWNRYISKPIQSMGHSTSGRRAMILLKDKLLKSVVLRRTKKGRAADLALPQRIVSLRRDTLDKNEQEFYEALYTQSQVQFGTYVSAGTVMNNYAHIFDLLTRLRQAVDHPYLVVYSKTADAAGGSKDNTLEGNCGICQDQVEDPVAVDHPYLVVYSKTADAAGGSKDNTLEGNCGICQDQVEDPVVTSCQHSFCKACLIDYSAALGNVSCPSCSKPLTVDLTKNCGEKSSKTTMEGFKHASILNRLSIQNFKTSTKIDALMEEVRDMVEADGSAKGIVFSQFTSFLDLIHYSLQRCGVKCVQLVGSMSLAERERAIGMFSNDVNCKIFLMSLKAGGVALNLTVASHVFLMDPWWNPAVERQAQDRIHRIGQYKPIRAVRFVIEDSIEERILKLQEKKEMVFEGTVGESSEAMAKLTEADLKFLFQN